jgi:hypothetical protein
LSLSSGPLPLQNDVTQRAQIIPKSKRAGVPRGHQETANELERGVKKEHEIVNDGKIKKKEN